MAEPRDSAPNPPREVDLEEVLGGVTPEQLAKLEFIINGDGSVTFVDFPPELMDIAYALNPDDPLVCERMALVGATGATPPASVPAASDPQKA